MAIWQLCANLLIPNCLRSNLSYSPLAALELYVKKTLILSFCFILSSHGLLRVTPTRLFGYKYTIIFPKQDTLKLLLTDIRYFFFKTDRSHVVLYNLQSKKQPKKLEVTNIQRILADDKLHSAKYSSKLDILRSLALSLQYK